MHYDRFFIHLIINFSFSFNSFVNLYTDVTLLVDQHCGNGCSIKRAPLSHWGGSQQKH